ncbi:hypothetical protein WMO79_00690 [Micrococcaceae bacterium Sec7.4]
MTTTTEATPTATPTAAPDRINPAAKAWAAFQKDTAGHQLTVLHEDGLYRHFRMAAPGTRWGSWDIITWPGHLATSGDAADGLTFSRENDMIVDFFGKMRGSRPYFADGAPSIDFRYWAEKLQGDQRDTVRAYVHEDFVRYVKETLTQRMEAGYYSRLTQHLVDQLIAEVEDLDESEAEARQWLNEHEPEVPDSWDHDFKDYTDNFQYACYAVSAAVQAYLARTAPETPAAGAK